MGFSTGGFNSAQGTGRGFSPSQGASGAAAEPAPNISYAGTPFAWTQYVAIATASVTNTGGTITSYAVQTGNLPTGISLNTSTGAITGTPTADDGSASVVIRATGPGGTDDATISVSVWTPLDMTPGLWLDGSDITTLWTDASRTVQVAANSDPVGNFDDKSGNAAHFIAAGAARPLYKTAQQNGRSAVDFDGINDVMTNSSLALVSPCFVAIVCDLPNANKVVLDSGTAPDNVRVAWGINTAGEFGIGSGGTGIDASYTAAATMRLFECTFNGASSEVVMNGTSFTTGTVTAATASPATTALGGTMVGTTVTGSRICELIYVASVPSAGNIASLRAYLNAKWAVY